MSERPAYLSLHMKYKHSHYKSFESHVETQNNADYHLFVIIYYWLLFNMVIVDLSVGLFSRAQD